MKILVDEMPLRAEKCPYSFFRENQHLNNGKVWWGCCWNGTNFICPSPEKCPFFTVANQEENKNGDV